MLGSRFEELVHTLVAATGSVGMVVLGMSLGGGGPANAQTLGGEFRVNTYTTANQEQPSVAMNAAGAFVVVWQSFGIADNLDVLGQRYASDGSPRGGEFRVNTYTTSGQGAPSVASDAAGNFVVTWRSFQQDGNGYGIYAQRFLSDGSPSGPEFRVNTYTSSNELHPVVASAGNGDFVVAWDAPAESFYSVGIRAQRFASGGSPLGSEFRVNSYTTQRQQTPSLAIDGAGRFVVAWESYAQDGWGYGVYAQRYSSDGTRLGGEFRVNTYTTNYQREPSVAATGSGDFVIAWYNKNSNGTYDVFGQRFASAGAALGPEFRVNSYTTGRQANPVLSSDSSGNFLVVWHDDSTPLDGFSWGVLGQRYGSDGTPAGGEFRVNTSTVGSQRYPAIASDAGGDFVVVWASSTDGSQYGVYAQRYCTALATVTINVTGSTTVCPTGTAGTASVTDTGGGTSTHQWAYRVTSGGMNNDIAGQTGTMYVINGADFPGVGTYFLVCTTSPACGNPATSNEVMVTVDSTDAAAPVVTPPAATTITQTICQ